MPGHAEQDLKAYLEGGQFRGRLLRYHLTWRWHVNHRGPTSSRGETRIMSVIILTHLELPGRLDFLVGLGFQDHGPDRLTQSLAR